MTYMHVHMYSVCVCSVCRCAGDPEQACTGRQPLDPSFGRLLPHASEFGISATCVHAAGVQPCSSMDQGLLRALELMIQRLLPQGCIRAQSPETVNALT